LPLFVYLTNKYLAACSSVFDQLGVAHDQHLLDHPSSVADVQPPAAIVSAAGQFAPNVSKEAVVAPYSNAIAQYATVPRWYRNDCSLRVSLPVMFPMVCAAVGQLSTPQANADMSVIAAMAPVLNQSLVSLQSLTSRIPEATRGLAEYVPCLCRIK
jgi:hypothetical protein